MAVQIVEGPVDRIAKLLRQHGGVGRMLDAGLHDRELVAAQPRQDVAFLQAAAHPLGHRLEQLVAGRMAERVVDALEMVEIEIEHRELPAAADQRKLLLELLTQQHAIGQVGERIVVRQVRDPLLRLLAFGDVLDDAEQILRLSLAVLDGEPAREDGAQPPEAASIWRSSNTGSLDCSSSSSRAVIRSASAFENTS